jgi:toxin ParE1/3/4
MKRLVISRAAEVDLAEILDFVSLDKPAAAIHLIATLRDKFELLKRHPLLGEARAEFGADRRSYVIGRYVIYYEITAAELRVARVLHAARDRRALGW